MKRLMKRVGIFMFVLAFCSFLFTTPAQLAELPKSRFIEIDGKPTVHALQDSKVVGTVVKPTSSGRYLLYGFTDLHKFHQYLNSNQKATAKNRRVSSFYEHINMQGAQFNVYVGTNVAYVGDRWNDRISSINPACDGSWTVVYQHANYKGDALAIQNTNNTCQYYFNLTQFRMSNGQSWNDQISSIRVY